MRGRGQEPARIGVPVAGGLRDEEPYLLAPVTSEAPGQGGHTEQGARMPGLGRLPEPLRRPQQLAPHQSLRAQPVQRVGVGQLLPGQTVLLGQGTEVAGGPVPEVMWARELGQQMREPGRHHRLRAARPAAVVVVPAHIRHLSFLPRLFLR
ncbi:hypothetical protein ACFYNM_22345 [Streptomyces spororaveus]|uniref:hypothetical protein n=1 Tax=Streptomyces spororaveus TaxID=284039 RepID=UPI0036A41545